VGKPAKIGQDGKQGKNGPDGDIGFPGAQGKQGEKGPQGDKGKRGKHAEPGPNGKRGPKGPQGEAGEEEPGGAQANEQRITSLQQATQGLLSGLTTLAEALGKRLGKTPEEIVGGAFSLDGCGNLVDEGRQTEQTQRTLRNQAALSPNAPVQAKLDMIKSQRPP